jgi:polyisoprenoid-binding protein YceI
MKIQATDASVKVPSPGHYSLVAASSKISFRAKHQFGLGWVHGTFGFRSGSITVAEPVEESVVEAVVDSASFASDNARRDKKVRSKTFLDTSRYPTMNFRSERVAKNAAGSWELHGQLTVKGVKKPAVFTVQESRVDGRTIFVTATATVDRYGHGMTAMKGMAGRRLHLTLEVVAQRSQ